ncbi:MAG TPA: alanine--tRNA ligase [Candidatus Thermoplasmatota archaeon]|nr:alanine--tRNA ligase [Candidatus Thermoplasmatota archaeon]
MDPTLAKMLDLKFFHANGYVRKGCPTCKDPFWTTDKARTLCGDSACVEYDFIGKPLTKKPLKVQEMREAFLRFFESKGHGRIPRNPVVARWRDDIYLNIASIANYQPHTTSGEVPPPANPLVVSQPCIRLNDLANIGRSGRHFSCFEMMGHHAFNSKAWGEKYWTEECVAYGVEFLTKILGLDGNRITFKESTWSGGGNAGPCVEVFAGGLEVATLVFMCLEEHEAGEFTIKGERYRKMDLRIIDTGWGLERLAWASTGTPTAYDTVFPETLAHLRGLATAKVGDDPEARRIVAEHARVQGILNLDVGQKLDTLRSEVVKRLAGHGIKTTVAELERVMAPVEALYALADHLRCLSFMVGDGIVPSNVKAGYLMRLVTRRALRFKETLGIPSSLSELLAWNMELMTSEFPEFKAAIPRAREIADLETDRARESTERGLRLVERMLAKKHALSTEELVDLYDTHGLGPNAVAEAAAKMGVKVEVPDDFDMVVAARHSKEKKTKEKRLGLTVPATDLLYYKEQDKRTFSAKILWTGPNQSPGGAPETLVVLDKTCFFAETGGQPGDRGVLRLNDGAEFSVTDTTKDGGHAIHHCRPTKPAEGKAMVQSSKELVVNAQIQGEVDWDLRMDHTRSHTATHVMNQSVRRVLGPHSWQAGTQKYRDCARVDMTHYRRPTAKELADIERLANRTVMEARPVSRTWWKREEAERKYGLTLLQGGIPKGRDVRVVEIEAAPGAADVAPFDVEYCGGTHCHTTAEVGPIKLWRTERIQDGVERFEYSAGLYAVGKWQETEATLRAAADAVEVAPAEVPNAARRFFAEWKEQRRQLETLQSRLAELESKAASGAAESVNGVKLVVQVLPSATLQKTAQELAAQPKTVALLASTDGGVRILFARSSDVRADMGAILRDTIGIVGGRGGGKPDFAQGGGTDAAKVKECLEKAKANLKQALA